MRSVRLLAPRVGTGVYEVGWLLAVTDFEVTVRVVVQVTLEMAEVTADPVLMDGVSKEQELSSFFQCTSRAR